MGIGFAQEIKHREIHEAKTVLRSKKPTKVNEIDGLSLDNISLDLKNGKTFVLGFLDSQWDYSKDEKGHLIVEMEQCSLEDCFDEAAEEEPEYYESSKTITIEMLEGSKISEMELYLGEEKTDVEFDIVELKIYNRDTEKIIEVKINEGENNE